MQRYGRIQGLVLSLWSGPFYRDVAENWRGIGFLYLLLLFALTWIPMLVKMHVGFKNFADKEFATAIKDVPPITIEKGKVSSPVPQPYTVADPKTGEAVFILDTTGEITSLENSPAFVLLTESKVHVRNQEKIEIHDLSQFPDMSLSKEKLQGWFGAVGNWLGFGLFPIVMIGSLVRALILMLLASIVGLFFNSSTKAGLDFGTLLRLAAVGMTLSVYLSTALDLAGVVVPFWFFLCVAITAGYVAFGVKSAVSKPPEENDEFATLQRA